MNDPTAQQDSSIQSDQLHSNQARSPSILDEFEKSFRFFPRRLDEWSYRNWYVLVGVFVLIVLVAAALYGYFVLHDALGELKGILTNWSIIPLAAALSLAALTFNRWRGRIPQTFPALLRLHSKRQLGSSMQDGPIQQEYSRFLAEYQKTLLSDRRNIPIRIIMIISCLIALLSTIQGLLDIHLPSIVLLLRLGAVLFLLIAAVIWGYFFGVGAWGMCVTGWYLKKLTSQFDLPIQASHPDKCGGLKILGDFCLKMALPILIGVILLGTWSIEATLFPQNIPGTLLRSIVIIAANSVLFLFALPLAFIAFFLPLWDTHRKMVAKKEAYEDAFADRMAQVEEKLQSALDKGTLEEAKAAKAEMEIRQSLHPDTIGYPVWPFDRRIFLTFFAPQIVPIVSLMVQISQWLIH